MPVYYFDIRDQDAIVIDESGLELPDLQAAQVEAARSLADIVDDMPTGTKPRHIAIEVSSEGTRLFKAAFTFELAWPP